MKKSLLRGIIFLALGIALSEITRFSPTPEISLSLWYALPAFGIFILFLISIFSLGAFIRVKIKLPYFCGAENALFDLSFGSAVFYGLAYFLTPFKLFSSQMRIGLWLGMSLFVFFGASEIKPKLWLTPTKKLGDKLLLALPFFIVLLKLLEGIQFPSHGDAYNTYLPAPRDWATNGNFSNFTHSVQFFLATSWESLYAWGTTLMGLQGGRGLDLSQFFAQWCSGGIAVLGVAFGGLALCYRLTKLLPLSSTWFPMVSIIALQVPVLRWTENLAKNDFGICFWGFSAFYFSQMAAIEIPGVAFAVGLLLGATLVGKFTAGLFGILLGLFTLLRRRKVFFTLSGFLNTTVPLIAGGLIGVLPVLIRNTTLTGNPVFPWLPSLFPGFELGASIKAGSLHTTEFNFHWNQVFLYFTEILAELPFLPILFVMVFLTKTSKPFKTLSWIGILALFAFTLFFRPSTEIRYQGPTLLILASLSIYSLYYFIELASQKFLPQFSNAILIVLTFVLLIQSNISFFSLAQIGGKKFNPWSKQSEALRDTGGIGKLWIRNHLSPSETLFVLGDDYPYYLMDYRSIPPLPPEEFESLMLKYDFKQLAMRILESQNHYFYISSDIGFIQYRPIIQEMMVEMKNWNSACKIYDARAAQVWDLNCLRLPQ